MKKRYLLLIIALLTISVIAGCGKKTKGSEPQGRAALTSSESLSRAEYIGLLGDTFGYELYVAEKDLHSDVKEDNPYYKYIQACTEWDVIDSDAAFEPDEGATIEFALDSAVRAIGLDKITAAGVSVNADDLTGFYVSNIAALDTDDLENGVSGEMAETIIAYAKSYRQNLAVPEHIDIDFHDDVKEARGSVLLAADGLSGTMADSSQYAVGDIIYWDYETEGFCYAAKVTGIDGNRFTCEPVTFDEVFSGISISGTFDGTITDVHPANENVSSANELLNEMNSYGSIYNNAMGDYHIEPLANGVKDISDKKNVGFKVVFDGKNKEGDSAHGEFTVRVTRPQFKFDYDAPKSIFDPQKVSISAKVDTEISSSLAAGLSRSIPLGSVDIRVYGPFFVRLKLMANIAANGDISISFVTENVLEAGWKKDAGVYSNFDTKAELNFEAKATIVAEASLLADVRVGGKVFGIDVSDSVINFQATTGAVAQAVTEGDFLSKEPMCTDVLLYVPLRWGINQESCIITKVCKKAKLSKTVWDSSNSPIRYHFHFEDGERTANDECTRGHGKEVVQEAVDEEGKPFDEYKIFDFEPLDFDFIVLSGYSMIMNPGESREIAYLELPEGYTAQNLKYEVETGSICDVAGGVVTARTAGSTIVKISTEDGLFSAYLAVTVNDNYTTEGFDGL